MSSLPQSQPSSNGRAQPWYLDDSPLYAWTDNFYWAPNDDDEVSVLEALELERLQDILDAPQPSAGERAWAEWLIENSLPPLCGGAPDEEPTPADLADLDAWLSQVDADYPPPDQAEDDFPRPCTLDDRHAFQASVVQFYATHPEA
jgi:hypothetical protein